MCLFNPRTLSCTNVKKETFLYLEDEMRRKCICSLAPEASTQKVLKVLTSNGAYQTKLGPTIWGLTGPIYQDAKTVTDWSADFLYPACFWWHHLPCTLLLSCHLALHVGDELLGSSF